MAGYKYANPFDDSGDNLEFDDLYDKEDKAFNITSGPMPDSSPTLITILKLLFKLFSFKLIISLKYF